MKNPINLIMQKHPLFLPITVWMAFGLGFVIFGAAASVTPQDADVQMSRVPAPLLVTFSLISAIFLALAVILPKVHMWSVEKRGRDMLKMAAPQFVRVVFSGWVIRWIIITAVGCFGVIFSRISGNPIYFFTFGLIALMALLLARPSVNSARHAVEELHLYGSRREA